MYYHFYISYYDLNKRLQEAYVENEENLDMIEKNYIRPFREGKPMLIVSGSIVRLENLESFRILKSEKPLNQILKEINDSVPAGVIIIYSKTDILSKHCDQLIDITNELIQ